MDIVFIILGVLVLLYILNSIFIRVRLKRIGANLQSMISQGSQSEELIEYLGSEGYRTPDAINRCLDELLLFNRITKDDLDYIYQTRN